MFAEPVCCEEAFSSLARDSCCSQVHLLEPGNMKVLKSKEWQSGMVIPGAELELCFPR